MRCRRYKSDQVGRSGCMEHGAPDARVLNTSSGGDGKWTGIRTGRSSSNYPIRHGKLWWKRVRKCHPRIKHLRSKEGWHYLSVLHTHSELCHRSAIYWYGLYRTPFISVAGIRLLATIHADRSWNNHHRKWIPCRRHWDTRHRGLCQTSEANRALAHLSESCFFPILTEVPFLFY